MASTSQSRWKSWGMALAVSLSLLATCIAFAPAMAYGDGHHGHGHSHGYGHHGYGHSYGYGHHGYGHSYGYGHYGYSPYSSYGYYGYSPYSYSYGYSPYSHGRSYGSGGGSTYSRGGTDRGRPSQSGSYGGTTSNGSARSSDSHALGGRGWSLLAAGRDGEALSAFADQAESNPNKGAPKVGYALSAAMGGDLKTGVWAMRRACRLDPQAMHYVALSSQTRSRVQQLIHRYQSEGADGDQRTGSSFMLAALYYLTGDMAAAKTAIQQASDGGDTNSSTVHLQRLIGSPRVASPPAKRSLRPPHYEPPPIPPAGQQPPMPRSARTDA